MQTRYLYSYIVKDLAEMAAGGGGAFGGDGSKGIVFLNKFQNIENNLEKYYFPMRAFVTEP